MSDSRNVLITGASAGFGYSAALALAERGHHVFATMRGVSGKNEEKATALRDAAKAGGHKITVLELDVSDGASVEKAVASAAAAGGIDVLINNAGVGTWGIDEGYSVAQAQKIFDVNLFGVMRVNRAVVPHFRERGTGLIIYLSSGLGRVVLPFTAIYTASKFAVEAFAESTSYELSPLGIESVIVQPGAYGTTFMANSLQPNGDVAGRYGKTADNFAAFSASFMERIEAGGIGDPAEVVAVLVEEVERTGERPLRHAVGEDMTESVGAINNTCQEVQGQLLAHFGMV